jgi:hypothetical protein
MQNIETKRTTARPINPIDVIQMHDERLLTLQGLDRGLAAMRRTVGLRVDPAADYDVLAVALARCIQQLPACATPADILDALTQRATTPTEVA